MGLILPPMKPIPEGATEEEREQMYQEYREELQRLNPRHFNEDGTVKTFMQALKGFFGF